MGKFLRKSFLLPILIFIVVSSGSCASHRPSGFSRNTRMISRPHKNWKQPKSRYPGNRKHTRELYGKAVAVSAFSIGDPH